MIEIFAWSLILLTTVQIGIGCCECCHLKTTVLVERKIAAAHEDYYGLDVCFMLSFAVVSSAYAQNQTGKSCCALLGSRKIEQIHSASYQRERDKTPQLILCESTEFDEI